MIKTNDDLKEAFEKRFPTDWEAKKEFIKDLIEGNKVGKSIYIQECTCFYLPEMFHYVDNSREKINLVVYAFFSFS